MFVFEIHNFFTNDKTDLAIEGTNKSHAAV